MNIWPKLLLIVNLVHSIHMVNLNHDFASKFIGNAKRNADKVSAATNKISKLRLILLSDLNNQNEIIHTGREKIANEEIQDETQQPIDSCWSSSQTIKITAKSCPCNQIDCNAPASDAKRRAISLNCMQICCGNRYKKASIRSLSEAQIRELRRFSLNENCDRANYTGSFVFARIYERFNDKSICAGVLVHQKFLLTTAICVLNKKPSDLIIRFGSDQDDSISEVIVHPNFYKTIDTLQDNIAILKLDREVTGAEWPCIARSNVDNNQCHVFSWGSGKTFENSMKVDNVEVLSKGECYTSHLVSGKRHEKYVNRGNNNVCAGSQNRYIDINLSGSALTCHQRNLSLARKPPVLKGLLTWSTSVNFYPPLFTDVTQFVDWIEQTVNEKYLNSV